MNQKQIQRVLDEQLRDAAKTSDLPRIQLLLDKGADINVTDSTPLRSACENGHLEVVQLLLDNGADIHVLNDSPLRRASEGGHVEVVQLLISNGANIHADDDYALRGASENGQTEVTVFLFNQDPDYFTKLIKQDSELSANESLTAMVNHYRLGSHRRQLPAAPRLKRAL